MHRNANRNDTFTRSYHCSIAIASIANRNDRRKDKKWKKKIVSSECRSLYKYLDICLHTHKHKMLQWYMTTKQRCSSKDAICIPRPVLLPSAFFRLLSAVHQQHPIAINAQTTRIFVIKFNIYKGTRKAIWAAAFFFIARSAAIPAGESEHSEIVGKKEKNGYFLSVVL